MHGLDDFTFLICSIERNPAGHSAGFGKRRSGADAPTSQTMYHFPRKEKIAKLLSPEQFNCKYLAFPISAQETLADGAPALIFRQQTLKSIKKSLAIKK